MGKIASGLKLLSNLMLPLSAMLIPQVLIVSGVEAQTEANAVSEKVPRKVQIETLPATLLQWMPDDVETLVYAHLSPENPSQFERIAFECNSHFLNMAPVDDSVVEGFRKQAKFSITAARKFGPVTGIPGGSPYEGVQMIRFPQEVAWKFVELMQTNETETFVLEEVVVRKNKLAEDEGFEFSFTALVEPDCVLLANNEGLLQEVLHQRRTSDRPVNTELKPGQRLLAFPFLARRTLRFAQEDKPAVVLDVIFNPQTSIIEFQGTGEHQLILKWKEHVNQIFTLTQLPEAIHRNDKLIFTLLVDGNYIARGTSNRAQPSGAVFFLLGSLGFLIAL